MSKRQPQVGDKVYIRYNNIDFITEIISINGLSLILFDKINNNSSSLTWNGIDWFLPGNIIPTLVAFDLTPSISNVNFSQSKIENYLFDTSDEIKKQIMIQSDIDTINSLCTIPEFKNVCNDSTLQYIYHQKSLEDFPDYIKFKESQMKWKEFYERIIKFKKDIKEYKIRIDELILNGNLFELKIYHSLNIKFKQPFTKRDANYAIEKNKIEILKWLLSENILPSKYGIAAAVNNGYFDILKLLYQTPTISELFDTEIANTAVKKNNREILNWLEQKGILPDTYGANVAAYEGYFDILEWLISKNIIPNDFGIDTIISYERLDVLKWLISKGVPISQNQEFMNFAVIKGNLEIIKWLNSEIGILPTINDANVAVITHGTMIGNKKTVDKFIEILDWFASKGILPDSLSVDSIIYRPDENKEILKWLFDKNIFSKRTKN